MTDSNQCPICHTRTNRAIRAYAGKSALFQGLSLVECPDCRLVFASPLPGQDLLREYNSAYFEHAHGGIENNADAIAFASAIAQLRLAYVSEYLEGRRLGVGSVLEVGPGHGVMFRYLRRKWPGVEYLAVESDSSCRALLTQLGVATYADLSVVPTTQLALFDLAVASHVLEHTASPAQFAEGIYALLKPGGTIFVEVPCRDFEFKNDYEPHLLFFDKEPLDRLLRTTGFEDVEISYHGKSIATLRQAPSLISRGRGRLRRWLGLHLDHSPALLAVENPKERELVAPFEAHLRKQEPSWWLRALARRPS